MFSKLRSIFNRQPVVAPVAANQLYAIADIGNCTGNFSQAQPGEIHTFLNAAATELEHTDARRLYSSVWDDHNYVPLFTTEQKAKSFGEETYRQLKLNGARITVMLIPIVQMQQRMLFERVIAMNQPAILDPQTPGSKLISVAELLSISVGTSGSEAIKKTLVILQEKAANGDASVTPRVPPILPEIIYALVGNENGLSNLTNASPPEIRKYLDAQAEQAKTTDASTIYACNFGGRTFIPVFSASDTAKEFVNVVYRNQSVRIPEITVAMTVVGLNHQALCDRVYNRKDLQIVLDAQRISERTLKVEDLALDGTTAKILHRSLVWVSQENSNVDKAK